MKTKGWMILIAVVLLAAVCLSLWFLRPRADAAFVEVWPDGKLLYELDLATDRQFTVEGENGTNVITVRNGKIAVTEADCPDHYCMDRGFCAGGVQIVCLPNRLVIRFVTEQELDGIVG